MLFFDVRRNFGIRIADQTGGDLFEGPIFPEGDTEQ
jgi:hypothetical protein